MGSLPGPSTLLSSARSVAPPICRGSALQPGRSKSARRGLASRITSRTPHASTSITPLSAAIAKPPCSPSASSEPHSPQLRSPRFSSTLSSSTPASSSASSFSTINPSEISHFSRLASQWWSETGEFALLHRMNPARIEYIRQLVALDPRVEAPWTFEARAGDKARDAARGQGRWLAGKRCLDVGCGGGLLSESLARLGGEVVGVDASEVNIKMAEIHAAQDPFLPFHPRGGSSKAGKEGASRGSLEYRHTSAEALRDAGEKFDVVCAMEVVEHVDEPGEFMKALGDMVKPGGYLVLSTISRTPLSRLLTLTLAESVLRLVTPGTHTYEKFIKPDELRRFVGTEMGGLDVWEANDDASDVRQVSAGGEVGSTRGIVYDPVGGVWRLWSGAEGTGWKALGEGCNYMFGAKKRFDAPR